MKKALKRFIPATALKFILKKRSIPCWQGNFSAWEEASQISGRYDNKEIFEKIKKSALLVKNGNAAYERDSVIFDHTEYSLPLLTGILLSTSKNNGKLNIADFGGSLGTSYFQNLKFLKQLKEVKWSVIEQEHFVEFGNAQIANQELAFYHTLNDCVAKVAPSCVLLSSVLQYLKDPYSMIEEILKYNFEIILIDLTPTLDTDRDRITVQTVPETIYNASYPCRFLSESKMLRLFSKNYNLVEKFTSHLSANLDGASIPYSAYIFIKK